MTCLFGPFVISEKILHFREFARVRTNLSVFDRWFARDY